MDENSTPEIISEVPKTGFYKVDNVFLIESSFLRDIDIDFKNVEIKNQINITPEAHETAPDNKFGVTLCLEYKGKQNEKNVCSATIKMLGVFEKIDVPALSEDIFKKINAPAIIYPFIREHLHNICIKAGIVNIFLPTVNFKP
jgi:preprotein translocase subunit SecB